MGQTLTNRSFEEVGFELKRLGIIVDPASVEPTGELEVKNLFETKTKCKYCDGDATKRTLWADGRSVINTCGKHKGMARRAVRKAGDTVDEVTDLKALDESTFAETMLDIELKKIVRTPGGRVGNDRSTGSRSNGVNWVERSKPGNRGDLPRYVRIVRNGLMKEGMPEGKATAMAIAAIKRWARGGGGVSAKVKAAAAKALAEWMKMRAAAKGKKEDDAGQIKLKTRKHEPDRPVLARITDLTEPGFVPELKGVRYVRTPAGKKRFGQEIGSIIIRDGAAPLKNIRVVGAVSGSKTWKKIQDRKGKEYEVGQYSAEDGDGWGVEADGEELHVADTEEDALKWLDQNSKGGPRNPVATRQGTPPKPAPTPKKTTSKLPPAGSNKKPIAALPKGYTAHLQDDGQGRQVIRGTTSEGEAFSGYRTISGGWIAYGKDEEGWSNDKPVPTPKAAIMRMAARTSENDVSTTSNVKKTVAKKVPPKKFSIADLNATQTRVYEALGVDGKLAYREEWAKGTAHAAAMTAARKADRSEQKARSLPKVGEKVRISNGGTYDGKEVEVLEVANDGTFDCQAPEAN